MANAINAAVDSLSRLFWGNGRSAGDASSGPAPVAAPAAPRVAISAASTTPAAGHSRSRERTDVRQKLVIPKEIRSRTGGGGSTHVYLHRLYEALEAGNAKVFKSVLHDCYLDSEELGSLLLDASVKGSEPIVDALIARGADVNFEVDGDTPLAAACERNYLEIVELLLSKGADVEKNDGMALTKACDAGHAAVVAKLISVGADINANDGDALFEAASSGHAVVVQMLIIAGVDVGMSGGDALHYAARSGYDDVVRVLLASGADVHYMEDIAVCRVSTVAALHLLVAAGANILARNNEPLINASVNGFTSVVRELVGFGADVHAREDAALSFAAEHSNPFVALVLLHAGADVHIHNDEPLMRASKHDDLRTVEFLLAAGADVHARNDQALVNACKWGHFNVARALLEAGADVHAQNGKAINLGWDEFNVIRYNGDPTPPSPDELAWNQNTNKEAILELLLKAGATPLRVPPFYEFKGDIMPFLTRQQAMQLPDGAKKLWMSINARPRVRLGSTTLQGALRRARDRLDKPPTLKLGTARPTREQMVALLSTAGKRFAREYWVDGIPLFNGGANLGPVPEEFAEKGSTNGPPKLGMTGTLPARKCDDLEAASARGDLARVNELLKAGVDVHACDEAALRAATANAQEKVIGRLLEAGADGRLVLMQLEELEKGAQLNPRA